MFIKRSGFTLIEILIVTTIISLLGTVGFTSFSTANKNSRDLKRKADIETIKTGLTVYHQINGDYPVSIPTNGTSFVSGGKTYIDNTPQDPLSSNGYTYYYQTTNDSFVVCALLENYSGVYAIEGTKCKSDNTACNYCATISSSYMALNHSLPVDDLNCTPNCINKCGGISDSCGGVCNNGCVGNNVCVSGSCVVPTATPTPIPTAIPTAVPTAVPTLIPTAVPTQVPIIPTDVPPPACVPNCECAGLPADSPVNLTVDHPHPVVAALVSDGCGGICPDPCSGQSTAILHDRITGNPYSAYTNCTGGIAANILNKYGCYDWRNYICNDGYGYNRLCLPSGGIFYQPIVWGHGTGGE